MSNTVLRRVGTCSLGAVGAIESACTDLGSHNGQASIEEVDLAVSMEERKATDAGLNDAVVEVAFGAADAKLTLTGVQQITAANIAKALHAAETTNGLVFNGGGGEPEYFSGYFHGFKVDGEPKILHIVKGYITPSTSLKLGKEQQKLDLPVTLVADPDSTFSLDGTTYTMFAFLPDTVDTTAPTISSVVPADAATGVAKAATTVVAWTFSEAIRAADVHDRNFFIHDAAGAIKAGTLSLGTNGTVVTFTPTTAWAATTEYHAVAQKGVRDLAGNKLAAASVTQFTTGS